MNEKEKYFQILSTRAEVLTTAREATKQYLRQEGLYDKCKYLFIAGDAAYIDGTYSKQQCGSEEFLRMVKEIKPCLSYEPLSMLSNNYIVSFMYCSTEFFAVISRKQLKKEGMMKDGVPSQP